MAPHIFSSSTQEAETETQVDLLSWGQHIYSTQEVFRQARTPQDLDGGDGAVNTPKNTTQDWPLAYAFYTCLHKDEYEMN